MPFTYHYARVAKHLCDHALELFFKGAILQANKRPTGTHELDQLYHEFRGLCPGKKFEFTAIIDDMVKKNEERPASEYGRYPTGKDWKEWLGGYSYQDVGLRIREYSKLLEDFDRLVPLIKERYPD